MRGALIHIPRTGSTNQILGVIALLACAGFVAHFHWKLLIATSSNSLKILKNQLALSRQGAWKLDKPCRSART